MFSKTVRSVIGQENSRREGNDNESVRAELKNLFPFLEGDHMTDLAEYRCGRQLYIKNKLKFDEPDD